MRTCIDNICTDGKSVLLGNKLLWTRSNGAMTMVQKTGANSGGVVRALADQLRDSVDHPTGDIGMKKDIAEYIRSLSDIDLLEYVKTGTEAYTPDAVAFAEHELSRRSLNPDQLADLDRQRVERAKVRSEEIAQVAAQPLATKWRAILFILGMLGGIPGLAPIYRWHEYRVQGQKQKAHDMFVFWLIGFLCFLAVVTGWYIRVRVTASLQTTGSPGF